MNVPDTVKCFYNHVDKQCKQRPDCFCRSNLTWFHTVCHQIMSAKLRNRSYQYAQCVDISQRYVQLRVLISYLASQRSLIIVLSCLDLIPKCWFYSRQLYLLVVHGHVSIFFQNANASIFKYESRYGAIHILYGTIWVLSCQLRVTMTTCFVYKVIRDLESIDHLFNILSAG